VKLCQPLPKTYTAISGAGFHCAADCDGHRCERALIGNPPRDELHTSPTVVV